MNGKEVSPAFPCGRVGPDNNGDFHPMFTGMDLRDYLAACAPRWSLYDLRDFMDWPKKLPEGEDENEYEDSIVSRMRYMSHEERLRIEARMAYLYADIMLDERKHNTERT